MAAIIRAWVVRGLVNDLYNCVTGASAELCNYLPLNPL